MSTKRTQLFMSHTKLDTGFCDRFDIVASRVGIKVFRSEFETLETPPWKTIREEMRKSSALFLLVGNELVKAQSASETNLVEKKNGNSRKIGLPMRSGLLVN